ncbi:MAG: YbbR-like domain-containing protein [Proteobacteria bacterium]|nr:YbbR-like domain-containing protein [Desulfobacula sp.]MBU3953476.1 YbbR-like domain-containing protein [Pseudomonadota bacterium]MBU4132437.1 YbbR-like domain-containing protein [Pseudomonadota bacterium]
MRNFKKSGSGLFGLFPAFFMVLFLVFGCTTEPVETDLLLPVDFSNIPEDMVLTYRQTDKIQIRILADPRLLERINQQTILYPADLYTDLEFDPAGDSDSIEPGTYVLPVDKTRIALDPAIKILDITPSFLNVSLERKFTRVFKINVPYIGEPAQGNLALEPACEPAYVELTGAQSLILAIDELKTKPVDLTGAVESFKKNLPLDLEQPLLYSASHAMFTVTVPIQQLMVTKTMADIPIQVWNTTSKIKIEPAAITIEIKGAFDRLGNKSILDQVYAFIDLKGLTTGVYARHAYVNIPADLVMTGAAPKVFIVTIE